MPRHRDYLPEHESPQERAARERDFQAQRCPPPARTVVWVSRIEELEDTWEAALGRRGFAGTRGDVMDWVRQQPADQRVIRDPDRGWVDLETGEPIEMG